ncbi:DUF4331 family protein [Candidatus Riflebacteria bacterium]
MKIITRISAFILFFALSLFSLNSADHEDAPFAKSMQQADLSSLYAWISGSDLILVLTINPKTPSLSSAKPVFSHEIAYKFWIDNTGDAIAEHVISCVFSRVIDDRQFIKVSGLPNGETVQGEINTYKTFTEKIIESPTKEVKIFAGPRDDPFFFDFTAYSNGMAFSNPGTDSYKGTNISAIVIQIPYKYVLQKSSANTKFGVWASTGK